MAKLVKMKRDDHEVDVHPDMVEDYRKGGYVPVEVSNVKPEPAKRGRPKKQAE